MALYLYANKLLLNAGALAIAEACCNCDEIGADCGPCQSGTAPEYMTATVPVMTSQGCAYCGTGYLAGTFILSRYGTHPTYCQWRYVYDFSCFPACGDPTHTFLIADISGGDISLGLITGGCNMGGWKTTYEGETIDCTTFTDLALPFDTETYATDCLLSGTTAYLTSGIA